MDRIEKRKLLEELTLRIESEKLKMNFGKDEVCRNTIEYNPKYISSKEIQQLLALKSFVETNSFLTDDQVTELLKPNKKYSFLLECKNRYTNFLENLKYHPAVMINKIAWDRHSDEILNRPLK